MVNFAHLLRLWGSRLLWLFLAGTITVLVAFLPEGLDIISERQQAATTLPPRSTEEGFFRIEPWEQQSGTERHWHWSPSKYGRALLAYGKELLSGNPRYTVQLNPVQTRDVPVLPQIRDSWGKSVVLFTSALIGGILAGLLVGSLVVLKRARSLSLGISVGFLAIPDFYVVLLGQLATIWTFSQFGFRLWTVGVPGGERHWLLPVLALSILPIGYTARLLGGALDEIMSQDFIRTARSKGVPEWRLILGHAGRNALPRVLDGFPTMINGTLSSLIIVELLTSWPGMGRLLQPPPEESVLWATGRMFEPMYYGQPALLATVGLVFCACFIFLNGLAHSLRLVVSPMLREVRE